ncbi:unnamed protein product [Moneuplotes crassus]|uniref:Uncharacterized protein n=1 Tax=Euplotes crassus TaxID=5936 RepID=A0AAD2DA23_EUPCR|nr:unnamed protein product [Moneuplotes crassus]
MYRKYSGSEEMHRLARVNNRCLQSTNYNKEYKGQIFEKDKYLISLTPKNAPRKNLLKRRKESDFRLDGDKANKSTFSQLSNAWVKRPSQFTKCSPRNSYNQSTRVTCKDSGTYVLGDCDSLNTKRPKLTYKNFRVNKTSFSSQKMACRSVSSCNKKVEPKVDLNPKIFKKSRFAVAKSTIKEIVDKILRGDQPNFEQGCYEINEPKNRIIHQNCKVKAWRGFVKNAEIPLNYLHNESLKQSIGLDKTEVDEKHLDRFDPTGVRLKIKPVIFTENKNFSSIKKRQDLIQYEVMETGQMAEEIIFRKKKSSLAQSSRLSLLGDNRKISSRKKVPRAKCSCSSIKNGEHTQSNLHKIMNSLGSIENGSMEENTNELEFNNDIDELKKRKPSYFKFPEDSNHEKIQSSEDPINQLNVNRYVNLIKTINSK